MKLLDTLSCYWRNIQLNLFPWLEEELGELTKKEEQLIGILEIVRIEEHIAGKGGEAGRPPDDRKAIGRSFIAKAVHNMPTTRHLRDRLLTDKRFRRLCGWESQSDIPSESTFSRSFEEFSESGLPERVHAALIEKNVKEQLIGHILRDATEIEAREKPKKKEVKEKKEKKKKGRPKKGEERVKEVSRLEKQKEMQLEEMLSELPKGCDVGSKRNSKGYIESWIGYKLHLDATDNQIPVSCILTSASVHDSQVALPLAETTKQRVTNLYDLMDSAYDSPIIRDHSRAMGHVPIIDINPRRNTKLEEELKAEARRLENIGFKLPEDVRFNERSGVERVNSRLKDEFGGRMVRVRGSAKVMTHLMFGILALTADQLIKLVVRPRSIACHSGNYNYRKYWL